MSKNQAQDNSLPIEEILTLKPRQLKLEQIYLDPNNPRFGVLRHVQDARIADEATQEAVRKKIDEVGIDDLVRNIRRYGFVRTDPIVVRKFAGERYVVIEGNRRVTALKKLLEAHAAGDEELDAIRLGSIREISTLVYSGTDPDIAWIVQGIRHMSGIKKWPPPQQATFVAKIERELVQRSKEKKQPLPKVADVAKTAGLPVGRAGILLKSYYGFDQAEKDEELKDFLDEGKFSLFSEVIFDVESLQRWLGWDDSKRHFDNTTNLRKLLSWIVPAEENGEPKIKHLQDVRDYLPDILASPEMHRKFEDGSMTLDEAKVELQQRRELAQVDLEEIKSQINESKGRIETLPLPRIQKDRRVDEFKTLLEEVKEVITKQLRNLSA